MSKQKKTEPKIRTVDLPDVSETYVNSFGLMTIADGNVLLEMCVTRYDEPKPPSPPSGRKYPAVRCAMPMQAFIELTNKCNQMMEALQQAGAVKLEPTDPVTIQ